MRTTDPLKFELVGYINYKQKQVSISCLYWRCQIQATRYHYIHLWVDFRYRHRIGRSLKMTTNTAANVSRWFQVSLTGFKEKSSEDAQLK